MVTLKKYQSDNQQKCKIVSNQDQIKMSLSVKNVVAITFMYVDMNNLHDWD